MNRSCYRCGAQVEEHTTFCPSCGAPQIKVSSPGNGSADPASPPLLDAGTPASTPPSVLSPLPVPAVQIQWKTFWRLGLPLSVISGAAVALFLPLGLALFLASLIIAIHRYGRDSGAPLTASHGARLGAAMGSVAAVIFLVVVAVNIWLHFDETRRQMAQSLQQRMSGNLDPQMQQFVHWAASDQGFLFLILLSFLLAAVVIVVLSGIVGALTASMSRSRAR
jgi:hypothetical protein